MNKTTLIKIISYLIIFALGFFLGTMSPPAKAADGVPSHVDPKANCVEFYEATAISSKLNKGIRPTIEQAEKLLGTTGHKDRSRGTHDRMVKIYPACRVGGINKGFFRIAYYRPTMKVLASPYMELSFTIILTPTGTT